MFDQIQTPGLSLSLSLLGTLGDEGGPSRFKMDNENMPKGTTTSRLCYGEKGN